MCLHARALRKLQCKASLQQYEAISAYISSHAFSTGTKNASFGVNTNLNLLRL